MCLVLHTERTRYLVASSSCEHRDEPYRATQEQGLHVVLTPQPSRRSHTPYHSRRSNNILGILLLRTITHHMYVCYKKRQGNTIDLES